MKKIHQNLQNFHQNYAGYVTLLVSYYRPYLLFVFPTNAWKCLINQIDIDDQEYKEIALAFMSRLSFSSETESGLERKARVTW